MAKIRIVPGHPFNIHTLDPATRQALQTADDPNALCNWLPSPGPGSEFILLLRMYWSTGTLFDPTNPWIPPFVTKQ